MREMECDVNDRKLIRKFSCTQEMEVLLKQKERYAISSLIDSRNEEIRIGKLSGSPASLKVLLTGSARL